MASDEIRVGIDKVGLQLFENIGDGIIVTDAASSILFANKAAKRIMHADDDVICQKFEHACPLVNVVTGEKFPSPVAEAINTGQPTGLKQNIGLVHGEDIRYLSANCSPIVETDGTVTGCTVILRDVTRFRKLSMKMEADQKYMREVFGAAKVGLCVLDASGAIVDVNDEALEIMRTSRTAALGMQFGDSFRCENSCAKGCGNSSDCRHCPVRKNIEAAIMHNDFTGEFTVAMHSVVQEEPVWLRMFISQIWHENTKEIIAAMVDVSERKRHEKALEEAKQKAEELSRTKGLFMANISHEIRTPINGMTGMIDLTLRTKLDKTQQENLISAKHCAEDLLQIINDILDYSKLENGRMVIEDLTIDLYGLLKRVTRIHGKMATDKGLYFIRPNVKDLPRYIKGDPLRIRQVLHNLLTNAIKFTEGGSVGLRVEKGRRRGMDTLEFFVSDTGIGMDYAARQKLFQPFSQVDPSHTRKYGGTGLGLMIVKELVSAMGGDVGVNSVMGCGSIFKFWLPLREGLPPAQEVAERTIYLKPVHKAEEKENHDIPIDGDISELLKYCEEKLSD